MAMTVGELITQLMHHDQRLEVELVTPEDVYPVAEVTRHNQAVRIFA